MMPMEIDKILRDEGAMLDNDHLVLTSGRHSRGYVDFDPFLKRPELASKFDLLCSELALRIAEREDDSVLVGPETGGGKIATPTAAWLTRMNHHRRIIDVTAWKVPGANKEFSIMPKDRHRLNGERVVVVDDVLTSGSSLRPTIALVREYGGFVTAIAVMINRSKLTAADFEVPRLVSLRDMDIQSWNEDECKIDGPCHDGVPINEIVGHGRAYMERQRAAAR